MNLESEINKLAGKPLSNAEMVDAISNLTGFLNSIVKIYNNLSDEEKNKKSSPLKKSKYTPFLIVD